MNQVSVEKVDNTVCAVFSELKALGVKVPKIKKFKSGIPKQVRIVSSTRRKIFGVHLSEQEKISFDNYVLPKFIFTSTSYLKKYAQKEIGLFRKAGAVTRQKDLRAKLERGESIEGSEPNDVASLLKQWLRELPEPLIPVYLQDLFIRSQNLQIEENRIAAILLCCHLLPAENLQTLKYLLEFLSDIATNSEKNKMGAYNLAVIMAPNIFATATDSFDKSSGNFFEICTSVMELLITNVQGISVTSPCASLHFSESETLRNNIDLDLSAEALAYSPSESKKKRKSGPVQGLFTGFRKLVGQNVTPINSSQWLNQDDGKLAPASASRSASKHKADPEQLSMSPRKKQATDSRNVLRNGGLNATPNGMCSQDVLQEKKRGAHSRRKSFGLLRRKIKKGQKSTKQDEPEINKVESEANISTSSPFEIKLAVSLQVPKEDKNFCLEKSSPLLSDSDIDRILKSTFTKKSVSDCYLTIRDEYQNKPVFSTSSEGCLSDLGGRNSSYNLRSGSLNKRPLKRKSDVLGGVCLADKENFRQSISPRVFKKISPLAKRTSPKQETLNSTDVVIANENSFNKNNSNLILKPCDQTDSLNTLQVFNRRGSSHRQRTINMKDSSASSVNKKETSESNNCLGNSDAGIVEVIASHCTFTEAAFDSPCTLLVENEDKIKRQCSLKRQEAFLIRSKSSKKINSSQIRRADSLKIANLKSKNHINLQKEVSNGSDRNVSNKKNQPSVMTDTPEKKRIKRSVRNGSIIRGRPNTVKTGLPSDLCGRFNNDSISISAEHHLLTSTSAVDNDLFPNIVNEFEKNDLNVSLTLKIQNLTLSTPNKQISFTKLDTEGDIQESEFQATVLHDVKEAKNIVKKKCRVRNCSNSDSKIHTMKTRSSKVTRINSFPRPCTRRPKMKDSTSEISASSQKSDNNRSKVVPIEVEKENVCVPKTPLSTSDDVFKTPNANFRTPETWFSGREFLESEKPTDDDDDDVGNKRESIAMILRNKQGHVQQKVHMYDLRSTSSTNSTPSKIQTTTHRGAPYDPQYSNTEIRLSQSGSNRSVKTKHSHLPPPPKFVLPDSPLKPSYPLKELTNINNVEDTTFSPTPAKVPLSILTIKDNSPQKMNKKCTLKPKRNSYSGHTPYKLPKEKNKVLRSESSPLLQKAVNKSSLKLLEHVAASPLSTKSDQNTSFTSKNNSINPPVFKTRSSLSIDKLRLDQLTDEWHCEM